MFNNSSRAFKTVFDFYHDVDPERLRLIGAISLGWNALEGSVDVILMQTLGLTPEIAIQVDSRINGLDGKIGIIREASKKLYANLSEAESLMLRKAINCIEVCKPFRDKIIHMRIAYPAQDNVKSNRRKGKELDIYASTNALKKIYDLVFMTQLEVRSLKNVIVAIRAKARYTQEQDMRLLEEKLQEAMVLLRDIQTLRESLPRPPEAGEQGLGLAYLQAEVASQGDPPKSDQAPHRGSETEGE